MDSSPAGGRVAYGDESYLEAVSGGYYVLASVTFDPSVAEEARQAMRELRGNRRTDKLHWNEMDRKQREAAAFTVASLEGFHVVAVGAPVPLKRQERARAACLARLVDELYGYEVRTLVLESRGRTLDKKDERVVRPFQAQHNDDRFTLRHEPGGNEPLLWAADIVAGAVRAKQDGESRYCDILHDNLYDVTVFVR